MHATGYSAPNSAGHLLDNSSNTDTSGTEVFEPPSQKGGSTRTSRARSNGAGGDRIPNGSKMVNSSSSSDVRSVAASSEGRCRLGLARAKQETARGHVELTHANQQVAEGELEEALATSIAGSVGRVADLESNSGQ